MDNESDTIGIEISLLIASAFGKGIDVPIWLATPPDGIMPLNEFRSKLVSLSLVVGFGEEWETKREIELATSQNSIEKIRRTCGIYHGGIDRINVMKFLSLCDERIRSYIQLLMPEHANIDKGQESFQYPNDSNYDPNMVDMHHPTSRLNELPDKGVSKGFSESYLIQSPQQLPHLELESQLQSKSNVEISTDIQEAIITSGLNLKGSAYKVQTSSIEGNNISGSFDDHEELQQEKSPEHPALTEHEELDLLDKHSLNGNDAEGPSFFRDLNDIESELLGSLQDKLKSSTAHNTIQVYFSTKYKARVIANCRNPRPVVPKDWITGSEITAAFSSINVALSRKGVQLFVHLVEKYVRSYQKTDGRGHAWEHDNSKLYPVISTSNTVRSLAVSSFLHFLHLKDRDSNHNIWRRRKLEAQKQQVTSELTKALAGLEFSLSQEIVNDALESYEILSADDFEREVKIRVDNWVLDADGRRDFSRAMHIARRKWMNSQTPKVKEWGKLKAEAKAAALIECKKEVKEEQALRIRDSESCSATVTKDLFWRYVNHRPRTDTNNEESAPTRSSRADTSGRKSQFRLVSAAKSNSKSVVADSKSPPKTSADKINAQKPAAQRCNFGTWLKSHLVTSETDIRRLKKLREVTAMEHELAQLQDKLMIPLTLVTAKIRDLGAKAGGSLEVEMLVQLSALRRECIDMSCQTLGLPRHCLPSELLISRAQFTKYFYGVLAFKTQNGMKFLTVLRDKKKTKEEEKKEDEGADENDEDDDDETDEEAQPVRAVSWPSAIQSVVDDQNRAYHKIRKKSSKQKVDKDQVIDKRLSDCKFALDKAKKLLEDSEVLTDFDFVFTNFDVAFTYAARLHDKIDTKYKKWQHESLDCLKSIQQNERKKAGGKKCQSGCEKREEEGAMRKSLHKME